MNPWYLAFCLHVEKIMIIKSTTPFNCRCYIPSEYEAIAEEITKELNKFFENE